MLLIHYYYVILSNGSNGLKKYCNYFCSLLQFVYDLNSDTSSNVIQYFRCHLKKPATLTAELCIIPIATTEGKSISLNVF
jgi:hypothetical protein